MIKVKLSTRIRSIDRNDSFSSPFCFLPCNNLLINLGPYRSMHDPSPTPTSCWRVTVATLISSAGHVEKSMPVEIFGQSVRTNYFFIFILALSTYFVGAVIISSEDTMAVVVVVAARSKNTNKNPQIYHILFTTYTNIIAYIYFFLNTRKNHR